MNEQVAFYAARSFAIRAAGRCGRINREIVAAKLHAKAAM